MIVGHTLSNAEGVVLAVDDRVADLLRRTPREIVGMSYLQLTCTSDRASNAQQVTALEPDAGPIIIPKRYIRGDGSLVRVNLEVSRLSRGLDEGRLVGCFVVDDAEPASPEALRGAARKLLRMHVQRRDMLGADLFPENAWSMLLHLYLAEAEGRAIDAPSLGRAAGIDAAIVRRWIDVLADRGLLARPISGHNSGDPPELTAAGLQKIETLLAGSSEL